MSEFCALCGKPPAPYPNWVLSKGQAFHLGCLIADYHEVKAAHRKLFDYAIASGMWGPWSEDFEGSYEEKHWGEEVPS